MPLPEKFLKLQGLTPRWRSTTRASGLFTNIWVCRFATRKVSFLLPYYRYFSKKFVILCGNSRKITREIARLSPKVKLHTFWKDPHPVWRFEKRMIWFDSFLYLLFKKNREKKRAKLVKWQQRPKWRLPFCNTKYLFFKDIEKLGSGKTCETDAVLHLTLTGKKYDFLNDMKKVVKLTLVRY